MAYYEPEILVNKNNNKVCPLSNKDCTGIKCAWFLPIQKACSVQVLARGNFTIKQNK